ncbi:OmpA domain protein [Plesiocystis pacifica SIR-1]|uniref:OmpA domain protein n=1 Tax=Plesiocystis pacifica SIR-1 TaxID=391625 RepID=A6G4L3_9BACT|nr:OmpA family protein [Plesiocystis pacifica]EDM79133.1 OmpA domain protein [Plesiocystis pacifica SIR-1]
MRAKLFSTATVGVALSLGMLLTACGPIAFNDSIRYASAPTAEPAPEPEPPQTGHAKLEGDHIIIDGKIHFAHDSAEILEDSFEILDDVAEVMNAHPELPMLDIIGHTSTEGSDKHNMELSTARAKAVADYLAGHGVDASRVTSEGKGETEPIADESTEEGKRQNRRVEFKIIKPEEAPARGN